MNAWNQQKKRLLRERGSMCELCRVSRATDADHAVYPKSVGKHIDDEENCILLCKECHANKPDGYREWAWARNCERYGTEHMRAWNNALNLRLKLPW